MSLDPVRAVADAVLYEGYLLYPYRAGATKNRSRWQFGVLGPPRAAAAAFGEDPRMAMQCPLTLGAAARVRIHLRFLQIQVREVQSRTTNGMWLPVDALTVAGARLLSWDEAVEHEITLPDLSLPRTAEFAVRVPGGTDVEPAGDDARIVRRRWPLTARVRAGAVPDDGFLRLSVEVTNDHPCAVDDKDAAIRSSLIGAHLLIEAYGSDFVSVLDPPPAAAAVVDRCRQDRCWPVLAGPPGTTAVVLGAPIILYDHPQIAEQSAGALFDSTEIDEILTLRVMTMTEAEKAEARATDPRAAEIIDRCDAMSPADLQRLHGILRTEPAAEVPWWDPAAEARVDPGSDGVLIGGVRVARDSLVRVHPTRRADAQDLFFAGRTGRVTAVLGDVDGGVHVALVLVDDPAADLHDEYGRYFYFAPEELEPLPEPGKENRS